MMIAIVPAVVVIAYQADHWTSLFEALVGATATLTGLVFVAVSINLTRILDSPGLPERAAKTIVILLGGLIIAVAVLIPDQGHVALGIEIGAATLVSTGIQLVFVKVISGHKIPRKWVLEQAIVALVIGMPLLVRAVSLILKGGGGLFWIAGGLLLAIIGAVYKVWVLLIEILR